ncbi:hypothetical protein F5B20DRAFT_458709 [Whalleya microplaca]|nr:hypothetical protein F5B20DRAFT_458709 [Whalleya microplaca]
MSNDELGPLVRLWGIRTAQLPPPTATADELAPFLISILQEAVPFIDTAAPKSSSPTSTSSSSSSPSKLWKPKGAKSSPDSAAKVEVSERVVPAADLERVAARHNLNPAASRDGNKKEGKDRGKVRPETWCCRRSVHAPAAAPGTATWAEFETAFRARHAESEQAFTPSCIGAHAAVRWDCGGVEAREGGLAWGLFTLVVEEMRHAVGRPLLGDRTFPVLQMTCAVRGDGEGEGKGEFLVVSIPVPDFAGHEASRLAREKGAQIAYYVSVERFRVMQDGSTEWLMATASDAAGALPMWVQTLAAPGVIWKDVPLFLAWIAKERKGGVGDKGPEGGKGEEGEAAASRETPQVSTGVAVENVPKVSEGANDASAVSAGAPQVSTGVEAGKTAEVSGDGAAGTDGVGK